MGGEPRVMRTERRDSRAAARCSERATRVARRAERPAQNAQERPTPAVCETRCTERPPQNARARSEFFGPPSPPLQEIWNNFGTALDPKTIIHLWLPGSTIAPDVVAAGYRMLWSSSDKWYLDWLNTDWTTMYEADPCGTISEEACEALMLGGEGCMWGETVDTR